MAERVGFIGVGNMGAGMAANLLKKGFALTVLAHRSREAVEALVAQGAAEAGTPREMAERTDVVVLCVTGSPQVQRVVDGADGLAAAGKPLMIIDCSTSDPAVTVPLSQTLAGRGITLIDAPLGRTPREAAAGTLDVMVGASDADLARARPILEAFAGRIIHTGGVGTGHTKKLLNNLLSMGYAALYAEALAIAAKSGITAGTFDSVIRGGRMDCGFYQTFFEYVVGGNENAHRFAISNGLKDMTYLASLAQSLGAVNPVGAAVRNSFAIAAATGHGDDYVPKLSDIIAGLNGVALTRG
jgi:3-hydroxyisobutyrate dehydrogenase-like beta-hydroxyacid dehydrogenase